MLCHRSQGVLRVNDKVTILSLYREAMDEIQNGRNDPGYVLDMFYRIAVHPSYSNAAFGLLGSRIVKAHVNRLNDEE